MHLPTDDVVLSAESSGARIAPPNRRCCTLCRVTRRKKCTSQQAMLYSVQSHQEQEMHLQKGDVVLCAESSGERSAPPNRRCCTLCRVIRSKKCTSQQAMLYSVQSHQEDEMQLPTGDVVLCAESSGARNAPPNRRCCTLCVQSHQEQEMHLPTDDVALCAESSGTRNACVYPADYHVNSWAKEGYAVTPRQK